MWVRLVLVSGVGEWMDELVDRWVGEWVCG